MKLQRAFEMSVEYLGKSDPIRVDKEKRISLTDMVKFFPKKRLDVWLKTKPTKEFIKIVDKDLNTTSGCSLKSLVTKRGKYEGGTYAHEYIAMEFAMWLSPEFKLNVIKAYQDGTQKKENWNIKRILAANNYRIMTLAVEQDHEDPKSYHYSNEARMLNNIVFGKSEKSIRDTATEYELDLIANLEGHNSTLIFLGMDYQERKEKLKEIHFKETKALMNKREVING